jgi:predicted nucleic acid-binding Zn ribbon protein
LPSILKKVKNSGNQPLGNLLREFLRTYGLEDRVNESKVFHAWNTLFGQLVARHTKSLKIKDKVLYVRIDSSALRNELLFAREKIITAINNEVGANVINDLVIN